MLRFVYLPEPLVGSVPPSLPAGASARWRPLAPIRVYGPSGRVRYFPRALLDPGADDTIFPLDLAALLGIALKSDTGHAARWRGQPYLLRFGDVDLELSDD